MINTMNENINNIHLCIKIYVLWSSYFFLFDGMTALTPLALNQVNKFSEIESFRVSGVIAVML